MSNKSQIAQALAGSPAAFDSQGLQQPPEVTQAIMAMLMPGLGNAAEDAATAAPTEAAPEALPGVAAGSKVGDPHALYAYTDNFGPGMTPRKIYNVFGDPTSPAVQQVGWGSSVPEGILQKAGIPIVGKQLR